MTTKSELMLLCQRTVDACEGNRQLIMEAVNVQASKADAIELIRERYRDDPDVFDVLTAAIEATREVAITLRGFEFTQRDASQIAKGYQLLLSEIEGGDVV